MARTTVLGVASVDITPRVPLYLAGFAFRTEPFEGVSTPLELKCFLFGRPGESQVALFSADLVWWGRDTVRKVREELGKEFPESREWQSIFLATHTHCGPQTSCYFASGLGKPDKAYVGFLSRAVVEAARKAADRRREVSAFRYEGETSISVNRRKKVDGRIVMGPNFEGPRNPRILVTEFIARQDGQDIPRGGTVAVMVCATCHPTTSGDNRVDKEFLARGLDQYLRSEAPQATGMFIQGCCGDIRPALIRDGAFYRGSLDKETGELAERFADEMRSARKGSPKALDFSPPHIRRHTVHLPLAAEYEHSDRSLYVFNEDEKREWARCLADRVVPETMPVEMIFFPLSDVLSFLFMAGEVVGEYARFAGHAGGDALWAGGYAEGMTTYIPEDSQLREKGYEAYDSLFWFLAPAPFAPGVETAMKEGIRHLLSLW